MATHLIDGSSYSCPHCQICSKFPAPVAGLAALSGLRPAMLTSRAALPRPTASSRSLISRRFHKPGAGARGGTPGAAPKVKSRCLGPDNDFLERIAADHPHGLICFGLSTARSLPRSKPSQHGHIRDLDGGFLHAPVEDTAPSLKPLRTP